VSLVRPRRRKAYAPDPPSWQFDDLRDRLMAYWAPSTPDRVKIENDFEGYVSGVYKSDGIVYACAVTRMLVFSEGRFAWRQWVNSRPGDLFGTSELGLLERPWPSGTTGELLGRMDTDATLAGNSYWTTADDRGKLGGASAGGPGRRVVNMRPDWVTIIVGSPSDHPDGPDALDARIVAYEYQPRRRRGLPAGDPVLLLPGEVCHYSPIPDPAFRFRGMSWLTPVLREVAADKAATLHKLKFFEHGAVAGLSVSLKQEMTPERFRAFVEEMDRQHAGVENAYKTLYTAGGADVTPLAANFQQLDLKATQGAGETRIAAAARVPPVLVGLSEGLQGSSLNAGNFGVARRAFGDGTIRPLWRMAAASLQPLLGQLTSPKLQQPGVELTFDDRDVAYFREDAADVANIQQIQAVAIRNLLDAGYEPDAVIRAVMNNDLAALVGAHSGLFSVQLQPPGQLEPSSGAAGAPPAIEGAAA
jgi:hypothetical protein